jgi:hypothetical protein
VLDEKPGGVGAQEAGDLGVVVKLDEASDYALVLRDIFKVIRIHIHITKYYTLQHCLLLSGYYITVKIPPKCSLAY